MTARRKGGFTLIETLIAVSIFGTIAATIYLSFSTGLEAQSRIEKSSESLHRARFALELMAEDLRSPGRVTPGLLEGWGGGFRMALGPTSGAQPGAEALEYRVLEEPDGGDVLVRRLLLGEEVLNEVRLFSEVEAFDVAYFMSDVRGTGTWVSEWERSDDLPYAISVSVAAVSEDGSLKEYRRLIPLPHSWLRPPTQSVRTGMEQG